MLIVLDNAINTEQITSLLPGSPSCTVLVTSRRRLTGLISSHGARHLALDVLSDEEARALLSARLGDLRLAREPEATDRLIAVCGGFPLALSVVAGRAAAHPDLPLTTVVAELRDAGLDGLDDGDAAASVPAVLSWSYRALAPNQAKAFALLGIAPGPDINLAAAASLTKMSARKARTVLRDLKQASLLVRHPGDRYGMHDLIRACAQDHAEHDLAAHHRETALDRVIDFYVQTAHRAHLVLEPHDPIDSFALLPASRTRWLLSACARTVDRCGEQEPDPPVRDHGERQAVVLLARARWCGEAGAVPGA